MFFTYFLKIETKSVSPSCHTLLGWYQKRIILLSPLALQLFLSKHKDTTMYLCLSSQDLSHDTFLSYTLHASATNQLFVHKTSNLSLWSISAAATPGPGTTIWRSPWWPFCISPSIHPQTTHLTACVVGFICSKMGRKQAVPFCVEVNNSIQGIQPHTHHTTITAVCF